MLRIPRADGLFAAEFHRRSGGESLQIGGTPIAHLLDSDSQASGSNAFVQGESAEKQHRGEQDGEFDGSAAAARRIPRNRCWAGWWLSALWRVGVVFPGTVVAPGVGVAVPTGVVSSASTAFSVTSVTFATTFWRTGTSRLLDATTHPAGINSSGT